MLPPEIEDLGREKLDLLARFHTLSSGDSQARNLRCHKEISLNLTNNRNRLLFEVDLPEQSYGEPRMPNVRWTNVGQSGMEFRATKVRRRARGVRMSSSSNIPKERWIGRVKRGVQGQVVTSRGILHGSGRSIEYYTSQPSSSQWIALGVVPLAADLSDEGTHRVLVGTGETEQAAIDSLQGRLECLFSPTPSAAAAIPIVDLASVEIEPSSWFG